MQLSMPSPLCCALLGGWMPGMEVDLIENCIGYSGESRILEKVVP